MIPASGTNHVAGGEILHMDFTDTDGTEVISIIPNRMLEIGLLTGTPPQMITGVSEQMVTEQGIM